MRRETDGPWSWFLCGVSFIIFVFVFGFQYSFGLVFTELLEYFQQPRAATAWVGTLGLAMSFLVGPIAGSLCQRYGCRAVIFAGGFLCALGLLLTSFVRSMYLMYLTYGFVFGIGSCFCYTVPYIAVAECFSTWKSVAMGIASAGLSTGQLIMSPVVEYFLLKYGWSGTFRIFSGILFSICILAFAFRSNNSTDVRTSELTRKELQPKRDLIVKHSIVKKAALFVDFEIWRIRYFAMFATSTTVVMIGYFVPRVFLADYCRVLKFTTSQATYLYMAMAVASTIGRVLTGVLSDTLSIKPILISQITLTLSGILSLSFTLIEKYDGLLVAVIVYGLCDGAVNVQFPLVVLDCVGLDRMPQAWGSIIFLHSIAIGVGSPLAGLLADKTNSYYSTFLFGGGFVVLGSLLLFLLRWIKPEQEKN